MIYACVRTDNMAGTTLGKDLVTFKAKENIENGCVVKVGAFVGREIRDYSVPVGTEKLGEIALIASPEVVKGQKYNALNQFINEKDSLMRGYIITPADTFSLTKEGFAEGSDFTKGNIVELAAGNKLKAVKTATDSMTQIGVLGELENGYYLIDVVKAY